MWFACLLISPAFLIIGLSHWASLLLCWKPRWPKIIQEAGKPGKPVPKISSIDDYPPKIAEELKRKSHIWMVRPGDPEKEAPEKPKRPRRKRPPKTSVPEPEPEMNEQESTQDADPPTPWPKGKRVKVDDPLWPN
jgi:hypothetical protein